MKEKIKKIKDQNEKFIYMAASMKKKGQLARTKRKRIEYKQKIDKKAEETAKEQIKESEKLIKNTPRS